MVRKVLYFSHGNEALYDLVREAMPKGYQLVTLASSAAEERLAKIADCEAVIVGGFPLTRPYIEAARRLRLVQHQGVGYHDTVDLDALRERQIALALAPGGTSIGVSEHAIMLMLAVCKRLPFVDAELRQGRWHANDLRAESRQLFGMTVGILGLGRIGREVARRLIGFSTETIYHDILDMPSAVEKELRVHSVRFPELLAKSDILTLHVPLTEITHHMIDADALAQMKPSAMLINCARGPVVDEAALAAALERGHLGGAGLDVFEEEPPSHPSPLARFHNVVLTPHHAPGTVDAMREKMGDAFANIRRFFAGEALDNRVELG
ncbi:MAG: 3-phosphoglycerate dehydrogenase [Proteobacteria bacterium]|nr:3-phosphoglycerate dehydrogenase [Pseudomonadota bacterium]MBI3498806.1 3-phosphoglycerate dehydrogenase [Pseudomonadota bacterium]